MRPAHVLQLIVLSLCWGTAYLFMRASVPSFGAAPMIFLRLALAALLVLGPLMLARVGIGPLRRHWRDHLVMGVLFTALPFFGLGFAARSISAGMLAIIQSAAPLFAAIVGHFWLRERINRSRALGLVIGGIGVTLLVGDRISLSDQAGIAILVTLLVTATWGLSSNYARVHLHTIDPTVVATGSLGIAAILMGPFAWAAWPESPPSARAWAEVLFLGVVSSGLGFFLYFRLLGRIGAVRTTSVTFLNPIVAMISGAWYLSEAVTWRMLGACAVILLGTALTLGLLPLTRWRSTAATRQ